MKANIDQPRDDRESKGQESPNLGSCPSPIPRNEWISKNRGRGEGKANQARLKAERENPEGSSGEKDVA